MIIADTNVISTFARIVALDHVRQLVNADRLYVTPATFTELRRAVNAGCDFLTPTLAAKDLPGSLGAGEAESIAVCLNRSATQLLTNDKRARNFCRERAIPCLDLPGILRALWVRKVLSKKRVGEPLRQIETEEGMVIKNKDEIFK